MKLIFGAVIFALFLTANMSHALIYDDFSSNSINSSLWSVGSSHYPIFSQSGGYLYADRWPSYGGEYGNLTSTTKLSGDFQLTTKFADFYADGVSIGDRTKLTMYVGGVSIGRYFWENDDHSHSNGFVSNISYSFTESTAFSDSGLMRISRIGSNLSTFYNEGAGWIALGTLANCSLDDMNFGFRVYTTDTGPFHVGIDTVELNNQTPVPEPSIIFLTVSGLAGLAIWRRKK